MFIATQGSLDSVSMFQLILNGNQNLTLKTDIAQFVSVINWHCHHHSKSINIGIFFHFYSFINLII